MVVVDLVKSEIAAKQDEIRFFSPLMSDPRPISIDKNLGGRNKPQSF